MLAGSWMPIPENFRGLMREAVKTGSMKLQREGREPIDLERLEGWFLNEKGNLLFIFKEGPLSGEEVLEQATTAGG